MKLIILTLLAFSSFAISDKKLLSSPITFYKTDIIQGSEFASISKEQKGKSIFKIYKDKKEFYLKERKLSDGFLEYKLVTFDLTKKSYLITTWSQGMNGTYFNIIDLRKGKQIYEDITYRELIFHDSFDHLTIEFAIDVDNGKRKNKLVKLLADGKITDFVKKD